MNSRLLLPVYQLTIATLHYIVVSLCVHNSSKGGCNPRLIRSLQICIAALRPYTPLCTFAVTHRRVPCSFELAVG